MKKHMFVFLLCTSLLCSAGCSKLPADSSTISQEQTDTESKGNSKDASTENSTDTQDASEPLSSALYDIISEQHTDNFFSNKNKNKFLLQSRYDTMELQGDGYDALKTAVAQWQKESQDSLQPYIKDLIDIAEEHSVQAETFYNYSISQTYQIMYSDTKILSILEDYYEYTGGAHPSYSKSGINFDAATGKRLSLEDIVIDFEAFRQQALPYILKDLKNSDVGQSGGFYENYEAIVRENFYDVCWYFNASGITLIYNPYEIAPYAAGEIQITLPISEFGSLLKEAYLPCTGIGYTSVPAETVLTYTSGAADTVHTLLITNEVTVDQDGYEDNVPYIILNNVKTPVSDWSSYVQNCYLIHQENGRILLAFEISFMSDDYETSLYDITNGTLEKIDSIYASISVPGTDTLTLSTYLYVLGTYTGYRTYNISGNRFQPLNIEYCIPFTYGNLTTIKKLPVTDSTGAKILLPIGTNLTPIATDDKSYLKVKDSITNEEYFIHFTKNDYHIIIDGVDEYEYFETLPYAG